MKRELLQNIKAMPLDTEAIDRAGFLSAVVAVKAAGSGEVTIAVKDCDTSGGDFQPVADPLVVLDGKATVKDVQNGDLVNFDLDLVGCKQYIKIEFTGEGKGEGAAVIVLGDATNTPVEAPAALGE